MKLKKKLIKDTDEEILFIAKYSKAATKGV